MFHTIITLVYIIPNIYVFIRIWQLFINKGYRLYYTLIYLLLAIVYPVSNLIPEGNSGLVRRILGSSADYILPFYLYLFLFVLVLDIFLLSNRLFKIISSDKIKTTRFKITGLVLIIVLSAGVVIAGIVNFNIRINSEIIDDNLRIEFKLDFRNILAWITDFKK